MVTFLNRPAVHGGTGTFLAVRGRRAACPAAHRKTVRGEQFPSAAQRLRPPATPGPGPYATVEESA